MPLLAVAAPLVGAILIVASHARPRLRETWTVLAAVATFGFVSFMYPTVLGGDALSFDLLALGPDIELALRVDPAGMLFAASASALWIAAGVYSIGYVAGANEKHRTRYFAFFALCVSSTIGLSFAANFFTFFVFYELLTLATYPLVVHKQTPEALAAGRKYLTYLLGGGTALLLAVGAVQLVAPGEAFAAGGYLAGRVGDVGVIVIVALALLGFGTKAAVMPFHGWLPAAMVAPTPVSALLHAVAVVKAGVFGFVRVFGFVVGPELLTDVGASVLIASTAAVTIVVASFIALRQDNLKRRLAYSTVAHLSLIVLGVSLLSEAAWSGALLHIANHAVLKITLFFCAGAIYVTTGVDRVSRMDGIGTRMPFTMAAFGIASIGLIGLPPVGGFVSKWFLGLGTVDTNEPWFTAIVLGSGLLTAAYLLPIVHRAFFRRSIDFTDRGDARPAMLGPLIGTAGIALLLGLGDLFGIGELASDVGRAVTGGST